MSKQHLIELGQETENLVEELSAFFHVDDFSMVIKRSLALAKVAMEHSDDKGRLAICSDNDNHLMMIDLTK